jgi:imidazole glycerol-phosphate synthase subunit HisF
MRRIRVIPTLLMEGGGLVKTVRFKERKYVGDPLNTIKILNDKEVDELVLLDIAATREGRAPDIARITEVAEECFMPLAYGGGISKLSQIKAILNAGVEKVILNTAFFNTPELVNEAASVYGSQSIVVSIDVKKKTLFGGYQVITAAGKKNLSMNPVAAAKLAVEKGAGEIFVNSIDRDGLMTGYDTELIRSVAEVVSVPVIACGGAGKLEDFVSVVKEGKASAVAAGAFFVFKGPHRAVLVNYPSQEILESEVYSEL